MTERLPKIGAAMFVSAALLALLQVPLIHEALRADPNHIVLHTICFACSALLLAFGMARVQPRPDRRGSFRLLILLPLLQATVYLLLSCAVMLGHLTNWMPPTVFDFLLFSTFLLFVGGFLLASPLYIFAQRAGWLLAAAFLGPGLWFLTFLLLPLL